MAYSFVLDYHLFSYDEWEEIVLSVQSVIQPSSHAGCATLLLERVVSFSTLNEASIDQDGWD